MATRKTTTRAQPTVDLLKTVAVIAGLDLVRPPAAADVAKALGKSPKAFTAEFGNVEAYLSAVQLQFFQGRLNEVVESLKTAKSGFDAIERALTAYLEYTLRHREVYALLIRVRALYPTLAAETQSRLKNSILMLQVELRGLGCPQAGEVSRMAFAMVLELVKMENEMHARLPELRKVLWAMIRASVKT